MGFPPPISSVDADPSDAGESSIALFLNAAGSGLEEVLLRINTAVGSKLSLSHVLDTILEVSLKEVSAQEGSVLLHDGNPERLEMLASRGLPAEISERGYLNRKGSIAEWVIEHDEPLILNGAVKEQRFEAGPQRRHIVSSMCLPLRDEDQVIGTLNLNRTAEGIGVFTEADQKIMTLIAGYAASSIAKARLHEAVLHAERLAIVGQTVSGVAHCIKNMLTSLQGGLSICKIAAKNEDWHTFNEGSGLLERAVSRVSALALDMLEYSKDRRPVMMDVPLKDLFNELVELKRPAAEKNEVTLSSRIDVGADTVWADGNQLFRCLLNLLDNSIDACRGGGEVTITSYLDTTSAAKRKLNRLSKGAITIQVTDNGPGIPPENAERIFDPFFSTKGSKGTGLGLAVTRKIIREHGGEVDLQSIPHVSTVFSIYLPSEHTACDSPAVAP